MDLFLTTRREARRLPSQLLQAAVVVIAGVFDAFAKSLRDLVQIAISKKEKLQRALVEDCRPDAFAAQGEVSSWLRTGSESSRVPVVALEATRTAELLPAELWPVKPLCPQGSAPHEEATHARPCLLAAGGTVSSLTILCNAQ